VSKPDSLANSKWLTADDIGALVGLDPQTIYDYAKRGEIACLRLSRKVIRFRVPDVERWLSERYSASGEASVA